MCATDCFDKYFKKRYSAVLLGTLCSTNSRASIGQFAELR